MIFMFISIDASHINIIGVSEQKKKKKQKS